MLRLKLIRWRLKLTIIHACVRCLQAPSLHQELQKQLASQAALGVGAAAGPTKPVSTFEGIIKLLLTLVVVDFEGFRTHAVFYDFSGSEEKGQ